MSESFAAIIGAIVGAVIGFHFTNCHAEKLRKRAATDSYLTTIADLRLLLDTQRKDPIVFYERSLTMLGGAVYRYVIFLECDDCRNNLRSLWREYLSHEQKDSERTDTMMSVEIIENLGQRPTREQMIEAKGKIFSEYLERFSKFAG